MAADEQEPTAHPAQDTPTTPEPEDDPATPARSQPDPEREGDPDERAAGNTPTGDDEVGA